MPSTTPAFNPHALAARTHPTTAKTHNLCKNPPRRTVDRNFGAFELATTLDGMTGSCRDHSHPDFPMMGWGLNLPNACEVAR